MLHFFNTFDNYNNNKIFNLKEVLKVYLIGMRQRCECNDQKQLFCQNKQKQ